MSVSALSPHAQELYRRVEEFMKHHVLPADKEIEEYSKDPKTMWTIHPCLEELKVMEKPTRQQCILIISCHKPTVHQ